MVTDVHSEELRGRRARWDVAGSIPAEILAELGGLSPMLCHLVYQRGYRTVDEIAAFFASSGLEHDPGLLPDVHAAVARIRQALDAGEGIAVYGDFDCDGLTATAVLAEALRAYGAEPTIHVPNREDGHGLRSEEVSELAAQGVTLIITADCGVSAVEEIALARTLGVDVIVTDHHEPRADGSLPDCLVVNPIRQDSLYPFRGLAGVGVAYKVVQALVAADPGLYDVETALDLVALGTVADVVPLRDENRGLVMRGLVRLRNTKRPGLLALLEVAGVDRERLDPISIAFYLAPRVNAANRLADPNLAYALITAADTRSALELARTLSRLNEQRQQLVAQYEAEVMAEIGDPDDLAAAVESGQHAPILMHVGSWTAGISGLLASRLVERYGLPAFVGSEGDGMVSVSARGVEGIHIDEILEACQDAVPGGLFETFGGHARAGGFRVHVERWPEAVAALVDVSRRLVSTDALGRIMTADAHVPLGRLDLHAAEQVQRLAPFGSGFTEPLFLVRDVTVRRVKPVGATGKHAKLGMQQGDAWMEAVHFNADDDLLALPPGSHIDLLCHIQINEWRGNRKAELSLRDWRLCG